MPYSRRDKELDEIFNMDDEDEIFPSDKNAHETIIIDKDILCTIVECERIHDMAPLYDKGQYVIIGKHVIVVCYLHGEKWLRTLKVLPRETKDIEHIPKIMKKLSKAGKTFMLPWTNNIIRINGYEALAGEDLFDTLLAATIATIRGIPLERLEKDYLYKMVPHMEVLYGTLIEKCYYENLREGC